MRLKRCEVLLAFGVLVLSSCASEAQKKTTVRQIAFSTLHYRRPVGASADPKAGPGGEDYTSHPLPDAGLDCKPIDKLLSTMKLAEMRQCLNQAREATTNARRWVFTLSRVVQPELVLEKEELKKDQTPRPACVDQLFARLPVPREIFYQAEPDLACYASGIAPEEPPKLGIRLTNEKTQVEVDLKSQINLSTDAETRRLLLSWVLRPFWNQPDGSAEARFVPEKLCKTCVGDEDLIQPGAVGVRFWPPDSP